MAEYRSKYTGEQIDSLLEQVESGGDSSVVVDDSLSETSTNPVENSAITKALNDKADWVFIGNSSDEWINNLKNVVSKAEEYIPSCGPCSFTIGDEYISGIYIISGVNPPDGGVSQFIVYTHPMVDGATGEGKAFLYVLNYIGFGEYVSIARKIDLSEKPSISIDFATISEIDALFETSNDNQSSH